MSKGSPYDKQDDSLKIRKSAIGPLEGRDPETGAVVWREKKRAIDGRGRVRRFVQAVFDDKIAERILARLWEGEFISNICNDVDFPAQTTVRKWTIDHPDFGARFKEAIDLGKKVRAEKSAQALMEIAESDISKEDAPGARLKADIHMWNAEVADPENYGKRTKITGDANQPLQFVISTGFPELNPHQTAPRLGEDGIVLKEEG